MLRKIVSASVRSFTTSSCTSKTQVLGRFSKCYQYSQNQSCNWYKNANCTRNTKSTLWKFTNQSSKLSGICRTAAQYFNRRSVFSPRTAYGVGAGGFSLGILGFFEQTEETVEETIILCIKKAILAIQVNKV